MEFATDDSSFGITVARKHELKWLFYQEKAPLHTVNDDHTNSEAARAYRKRVDTNAAENAALQPAAWLAGYAAPLGGTLVGTGSTGAGGGVISR